MSKPGKYYYNENVTWDPWGKDRLDKLGEDELIKFRRDFITKSDWHHAKVNDMEMELTIYAKELMVYSDLRFSQLHRLFSKWEKDTGDVEKFVSGLGIERVLLIEKQTIMESIPNHKYILGLTWEEYRPDESSIITQSPL